MAEVSIPLKILAYLRTHDRSLPGALMFLAGIVAFMGIITAEALYPEGYSTHGNEISDLGATRPPDSIIEQPSSTIFGATMMVTGLLILVSLYSVHSCFRKTGFTVPLAILGIGILGVGMFNGSWGGIHATFALITFIFGGVTAVMTYFVLSSPMRYLAMALGVISLGTLLIYMFSGEDGPLGAIGIGGIERWVAYPIILWITGFGGHLLGSVQAVKT
jgi:hypothetical membrane protein